jgi:hypothetical protein
MTRTLHQPITCAKAKTAATAAPAASFLPTNQPGTVSKLYSLLRGRSADMTFKVIGVPYPDTNEESWEIVLRRVGEHPNNVYWLAYKKFACTLLDEAIAEGIHHYFRAGTAMSQIILSTSDRRLEYLSPPPPRVTLQCETQLGFISWSHANIFFSEPERRENISERNALQTVRSYLKDLWKATRPDDAVPLCLKP